MSEQYNVAELPEVNQWEIKQGDPVRVRLATGEVVDAVYREPSDLEKCHEVVIEGIPYLALGGKHERRGVLLKHECRFVGPTPMVKKENNNE